MKFLLGSGKRKDKLIDSQSSYIQIPPAPLQVNLLPLEDQQEEHVNCRFFFIQPTVVLKRIVQLFEYSFIYRYSNTTIL